MSSNRSSVALRNRRLLLGCLVAISVSALVDRVALYWWGWRVLAASRGLHNSFTTSAAIPLKDVRPPWYSLHSDRENRFLDLFLEGALVRPDRITLDESGYLSLLFLPPRLAWSTHLFPPSPHASRHYYAYTIIIFIGETRAEVKLYRHFGPDLVPVPEGSYWPRFF